MIVNGQRQTDLDILLLGELEKRRPPTKPPTPDCVLLRKPQFMIHYSTRFEVVFYDESSVFLNVDADLPLEAKKLGLPIDRLTAALDYVWNFGHALLKAPDVKPPRPVVPVFAGIDEDSDDA